MALETCHLGGEQGPRRHRAIAVGLQIGDRLRGLLREVFAAAIERRRGPHFEIGDARVGGVEPATLLLVLGDRQRQAPLASLDCGRRIAHLLIENEQCGAVFQFLFGGSHTAAEQCQNGLEHCVLPVMSVAHELDVAKS